MATKAFEQSKKDLSKDYQKLLADAEKLISSIPGEVDEKTQEAKAKLQATLDDAKDRYSSVEEQVQEQVKRTDELIREYPYHSAGIAMGIGVLVGLLLKNK